MGPTGQLTPPVSRSRAGEGADRGNLAVGEVAGDEVRTRRLPATARTQRGDYRGERKSGARAEAAMAEAVARLAGARPEQAMAEVTDGRTSSSERRRSWCARVEWKCDGGKVGLTGAAAASSPAGEKTANSAAYLAEVRVQ
jgi:hypothetical protein